jgi:hypothetical protein
LLSGLLRPMNRCVFHVVDGHHNNFDLTLLTEQPNILDLTSRTARDTRVDDPVRRRRAHAFIQGHLDAIRETHLFSSLWEV